MAMRKRSGSGSKRQLKEKIVQLYETFFRGEELPIHNQNFWDEFFLLKPKVPQLKAEIHKLTTEQLINMKASLNILCGQCVDMMGQEHQIRVVYSVQTLSTIVAAIMEKLGPDSEANPVGMLFTLEKADTTLRAMFMHCDSLLSGDFTESIKSMVLKLLLVIVTSRENLNENPLIEYLMENSVMDALVKLLCTSNDRTQHGYDVVVLMTILVSYSKEGVVNPYKTKLSTLDDELALNGFAEVITSWLSRCVSLVLSGPNSSNTSIGSGGNSGGGWLSSLTSLVGSVFLSDDPPQNNDVNVEGAVCILLSLSIGVSSNPNLLAAAAAPRTQPPSPPHTLHRQDPPTEATLEDIANEQPTNLFVAFFQYCSIIMAESRSDANAIRSRLCFTILLSMTEDHFANTIMHDQNLTFKVRLFRQPMRHRKMVPEEARSQILVETLIDLIVEFLLCHLLKKFPVWSYECACAVINRILVYELRAGRNNASGHHRHNSWSEAAQALLAVLRYLSTLDLRRQNTLPLTEQIINIFNTLITYGDTFLPTPAAYDQLYYEIIRNNTVFDNLYCLALRYTTADGELKSDALKLANSLVNIRAIIQHFTPKIDAFLTLHHLSTPSQDQILDVVRANYGSLVLKLCDTSEKYPDPGVENVIEDAFTLALMQAKPQLV